LNSRLHKIMIRINCTTALTFFVLFFETGSGPGWGPELAI
jgi:hypothetical protein